MQTTGNFHCDEHNRTAEPKTESHKTTMTIGGAAVTDKLIRLMEKELRSAR